MRYQSIKVIDNEDSSAVIESSPIDTNQVVNLSLQVLSSDTGVEGVIKLQASNEPAPNGYARNQFVPTRFTDIPNASVTITSGSSGLIQLSNIAFSYIRVVFTPDGGGSADNVSALLTTAGA